MFTFPMRGDNTIYITETTTTNFDIARWVNGGQALLTIVIASGVTVNSTDATLGGAIYSSVPIDPARSRVTIRNSGNIFGCNGAGGNGSLGFTDATIGLIGCDGVRLGCDIDLYNITGQINSGGGGGGGGGHFSGSTFDGGGGGGLPGGSGNAAVGETAQYGPAAGGVSVTGYDGGDCNGAGQVGDSGQGSLGKSGGAAGIGVNSLGNTVTIVNGAANIIGGTN